MTKVSIIIPCYNREKYIDAAINSALQQTHANTEVIVVDDGSTDDSWASIQSFGTQIKSVRIPNGGVSGARNIGLGMADGEFVQFLDSDDLLAVDGLTHQIDFAKTLPCNQILVGRTTEFSEGNEKAKLDRYNVNNVQVCGNLGATHLVAGVFSCGLCLYPRTILNSIGGFRTDIRIGEDYELNFRLFKSGVHFVYSGHNVIEVRHHNEPRLSCNFMDNDHKKLLSIMTSCSDFLIGEHKGTDREEALLTLACWAWSIGRETARNKSYLCAREYFQFARSISTRSLLYRSQKIGFLYWFLAPVETEKLVEGFKKLKHSLFS
ncbi:glycosyltransferase family 2 protein [Crenothrix sp.]|uniref:glycosyltransferase family 2 protein n=1 Tax=Crenothrix sp. TaxID=3100433 RepID=UPI00374C8FDC